MPDAQSFDPVKNARLALMNFFSEEDIDPVLALPAMLQLAAKISYDLGEQKKLPPAESREMWMGGCMLAYDAISGGKIFTDQEQPGSSPPRRNHLKLMHSGSPPRHGASSHIEHERKRNRQARKTRRTNRNRKR